MESIFDYELIEKKKQGFYKEATFLSTKYLQLPIYLDLFFEKQEKNTVPVEAAVNIWHNGNCAYAFSGSLEDTTSKIFSHALNSTNGNHSGNIQTSIS